MNYRNNINFDDLDGEFDDLDGEPGIVLPYHPAPDEEADEPRIEHIINPTLTLAANTSPRDAADLLRQRYTAEWIADLLVALLDRTAFTNE